jgi:phosphate transport system substrate-binding protein
MADSIWHIAYRIPQYALLITRYSLRFTLYPSALLRTCFSLFTLCILFAACAETPHATRTPVRLSIGDATEHASLLTQLIDAYTKDHEWVSISIEILPPDQALDGLNTRKVDLVIVPSTIKPPSTIWTSGFGYDSIVVVVNPGNPTNGLSLAQLRDLFQGKTFDWTPFGGTGDVIPVSREAKAFTRQMFEERVMGNRAVTQNAVLQPSAPNVIDFVANNPGAIGYTSISDANSKVKILSIEGVTPNPTTAASNQYLLSAPIYLIAQSEPTGDLREFVAWLLSEAGQKLISQAGLGRVR